VTATETTTGRPEAIRAVPVRHPGRWVAVVAIAVLAAMLIHSILTNGHYDWSLQRQNIFSGPVLHGVRTTIELTVLAMLLGVVLGIVLAIMRLSPNPVVSGTAWFYVWLFRGTPVYVQLLLWANIGALYSVITFGVPFGPHFASVKAVTLVPAFMAALLGLGLNEAAYMAEIVRAGILSVDEGQTEAAGALGMSRMQTMRRIVLPQAMRIIVPPTGNETISMLKTTSLVAVVPYAELLFQTSAIGNRLFRPLPMLIAASLWYLAMTSVLMVGQYYLERRFARGSTRNLAMTPRQKLMGRFQRKAHA
jgi:polar amino acid transport system permease protein